MEKRQKMNEIWARMKEIHAAAEKESRSLTAEEQANWDKAETDLADLEKAVQREERIAEGNKKMAATINGGTGVRPNLPEHPEGRKEEGSEDKQKEQRAAFEKYLRYGREGLNEKEYRNLQKDVNVSGGYLIPPVQFVMDMIKDVDNETPFRQMVTTKQLTGAHELSFPVRTSRMSSFGWGQPEVEDPTKPADDTGLQYGLRNFKMNKGVGRIKVANTLLRVAGNGPEAEVRAEFAYLFATNMEQSYMTGTGFNQPLGIFVASSLGLNTDRDVSSGSATDITFDGLINAQGALKPQYDKNATWLFHRDAVTKIRKQKAATTGEYLWQPPAAGRPPTILGKEYTVSEYVPNTITSAKYVGMYADWKRLYYIIDSLEMEIVRLDERYADQDLTGFIGRFWTDGAPVQSQAAVRLKTD